jgi:hypothetical protein
MPAIYLDRLRAAAETASAQRRSFEDTPSIGSRRMIVRQLNELAYAGKAPAPHGRRQEQRCCRGMRLLGRQPGADRYSYTADDDPPNTGRRSTRITPRSTGTTMCGST